jgi:hypothetical protein
MDDSATRPDEERLEDMQQPPPGLDETGGMAVVIVNYNTRDHLSDCLTSVMGNDPGEVVVVDNASSDGSAEMVRSEFPTVQLQVNQRNAGYGTAANQGISRCLSDYVLLLNSDTILPGGALNTLSAYMDQNPQTGVVGPRLEYPDGRHQVSSFPFPTPLYTFLRSTSIGSLIGRIPYLRERYLPSWSHTRARCVPWVLGAAMGIRKKAFDSAGCFDESFFMFSEEVDLCYRLWSCGWEVHFSPVVTIVHIEGASTKGRFAEMELLRYSSTHQFYRHHYSQWRILQLRMLTTYFMLRNILFDYARLAWKGQAQNEPVENDSLALWKKVLHNSWVEPQKQ